MLIAAALVTGYISVAHTWAMAIRTTDIAAAVSLAPGDGRITALHAAALAGPEATVDDRAAADRWARLALRQDATTVMAASTLGLDAQVRGDTASARRLFAYAQALSRRDLPTQLWAIEDAVGRNDISGVLRHYDVALRTSSSAASLLFPVLGSAISEPPVRRAMIITLARRPHWGDLFVEHVAANGSDPEATALLFRGLHQAGVPVSGVSQSLLINTLAARGAFDTAWSYYAIVRSGVDRRRSRDPGFTADLTTPTVFDWVPASAGGVVTSIQRAGGNGVVDFSAPTTVGGTLLSQTQLLPPGKYRLAGRTMGIDQVPDALPYWALTCADGRELGRVSIGNSTVAGGSFAGAFSVPAGCPVQVLALVARPSDAIGGLSGQIEHAALHPVGAR